MKHIHSSLVFTVLLLGLACGRAEETNIYPKSNLELLEERSGAVLIRSTDSAGSVAGKRGEVIVELRETKDMTYNQRGYGVIVTVVQGDGLANAT